MIRGTIPFPTREGPHHGLHVGFPHRASACRCDQPIDMVDGDCVRCGHWTKLTIDQTWADRARAIEARRAPKRVAA